MAYRIAADIVVAIHSLWILFLIVGALLGRRYIGVKILHIGGLIFAIVMQVFGWYCPLTHIEIWLRQRHDPSLSYTGSFIINYAEKLIYIEISQEIIFVLTILLILGSAWIYLHKPRHF